MADTAEKPTLAQSRFNVSHYNESDFKSGGLRAQADYRDLGVAEATNGLIEAHVARRSPKVKAKDIVSKRHYHDSFQLIYCLKGWIWFDFEGHGEHLMRAGSSWVQPPGLRHKVLDRSDDLEVLEITMPAKYDTVNVE